MNLFFTPMGAGGDDSTRRPETKKRPNDRAFLRAVRPFTEARSIGLKAPRRSRASRCFARTKRRGDARSSPLAGSRPHPPVFPVRPTFARAVLGRRLPSFFFSRRCPSAADAPPPGARASASRRVSSDGDDPWSAVDDLRGTKHYDALDLRRDATPAQVRAAYRAAARTHHPDKGGDARAFAAVRAAFETLGDPARRAAYDALAAEHAFRYIPGVTSRARRRGRPPRRPRAPRAAPRPWLAARRPVRVCGRPSNKTCFACGLRFCDFLRQEAPLARRRGLHYPVADAPGSMRRKIAERELERKRVEDARRRQLADPNFRTDDELREIRAFPVHRRRRRLRRPRRTPRHERTTNDSRDITCGRRPRGVSTSPCTSPRIRRSRPRRPRRRRRDGRPSRASRRFSADDGTRVGATHRPERARGAVHVQRTKRA